MHLLIKEASRSYPDTVPVKIMYLYIIILGLDEHNSLRCDYETQFLIFIVKRFSI